MTLQLEQDLSPDAGQDVRVQQLGGRIGARIDGVRLSGEQIGRAHV